MSSYSGTSLFKLVKDPYERKARVIPGLLVALPLLVPLLCVYGPKHPILTSVMGLLGGCGAIYALASVARGRGKKLEEILVKKWGGMHTKIAVRRSEKRRVGNKCVRKCRTGGRRVNK